MKRLAKSRLTYNAADKYFSATQSIDEWCNLTQRLLATYKTLFDKRDETSFAAQKQLLLKVLDDGMEKMTAAHGNLEEICSDFNLVSSKLSTLLVQLAADFDKESEYMKAVISKIRRQAYGTAAVGAVLRPFGLILSYSVAAGVVEGQTIPEMQRKFVEIKNFYETLKTQVEKSNTDIKTAKSKLDADIETIGLQSTQTGPVQETAAPVEMDHLHDDIIGPVNSFSYKETSI